MLLRAFVGVILLWPLFAQDDSPIRVDVRLVNVSFTVRDASGKLVTGLTKDDFEVLDDGSPQPISFFARSADLPLRLGLVVDVSGSQEHFIRKHQHDLKIFLKEVLTPRDRAFLLCFGNRLRVASDFTQDPSELIDGLTGFDKKHPAYPELGPKEHRILGTAFYDALYYSTQKLEDAKTESANTRKALVVFSDGEDNSSAHHMLDAIEAAQGADVVIHGIRYTEIQKGQLNARNKYGMSVMARIARETGGSDYDAQKTDMKKSFAAISEELRSSYDLAYYHPPDPIPGGSFHKVIIRPKRPGLVVRAKTGYFANAGS